MNKKMVIWGLLLLGLLWSGNIIYYEKQVLKEPLFIKHYYDIKKGMRFQLCYIQNINSKDKVISIVFPEIGQQPVNFNEYDSNINRRYYMLKTILVDIPNGVINEIPEEYKNKVITKARICFSNGKVLNVQLGKIYLYSDEIERIDLEPSVSSRKDNTGSAIFMADKDINVIGINSKFYEEIKDILKISIDGKPLSNITFPIKLKQGECLSVSYGVIFNKDDIRVSDAYNFTIDVLTEDLLGNKGRSSCSVILESRSPEDFINVDIDALKTDRGRE